MSGSAKDAPRAPRTKADARAEIEAMPGLKEDDLNKLGRCIICDKPLLDREKGGITFYVVSVARAIWDAEAVHSQVGLGMMLGGATALARIMGPDRDLAKIIEPAKQVAIHEDCAHPAIGRLLIQLAERSAETEEG